MLCVSVKTDARVHSELVLSGEATMVSEHLESPCNGDQLVETCCEQEDTSVCDVDMPSKCSTPDSSKEGMCVVFFLFFLFLIFFLYILFFVGHQALGLPLLVKVWTV